MATVSSHTLNGVDGSHAGGITARIVNITSKKVIAEDVTDPGGRLSLTMDLSGCDPVDLYELTFLTREYWLEKEISSEHLIEEVVLRFKMPDPYARYHMPIILSPHGYSAWKSIPE